MSSNNPENKSESLRSYATRVFKQSSVSVVSSIAQTDSTRWKAYKVLVFLLCLAGFLYQSGKYLSVVLQYPTAVNIEVLRPLTYIMPAYTFCDNNGVSRRIFCEKNPDRCEEPTEIFCSKFPGYCGKNGSLVPKKGAYYLHGNMLSIERRIDLNVKGEDFIRNLYDPRNESILGPHVREKPIYELRLCYSLNDRVNSSLNPPTFTPTIWESTMKEINCVNEMEIEVRSDEMFLPESRAGIFFALHSPFEAVNPMKTGVFMKAGRTYMMYVSMEEEILQKSPYDTDCMNYTEIWEDNGRTGPRSQEMCKHNCLSDIAVQCRNCNLPHLLFPRLEKMCTIAAIHSTKSCLDNLNDLINQCYLYCRKDCKKTKFRYTMQESITDRYDFIGSRYKNVDNEIHVKIYLEAKAVTVYKHSPKYMTVEVFSSIGGFIGIWLGMSFLDLTDFLEGFFKIIRHSFKKRSFCKKPQ